MAIEEVTIDLTEIEITDSEIRRDSEEVEFSVKGRLGGVDDQMIENVMLSNNVKPISLSLQIENPNSEK